MSLNTSLKGRLRNTNLPKTHVLLPLFEAVVNSIHAIDERLYSLLDEREFDRIIIITPKGQSARDKLARISADIALTRFNNAETHEIDEYSINDITEFITSQYQSYFINQNFSFEIALSGNKIQAVASALICESLVINQCWYIQPTIWDTKRFTKGATKTEIYKINKNGT